MFSRTTSENGVYFYNLEVLSFLLICVMELSFFYTLILLTCSVAQSTSMPNVVYDGIILGFPCVRWNVVTWANSAFDYQIDLYVLFPRSELIMYINNLCEQLPDSSFLSWSFLLQCVRQSTFSCDYVLKLLNSLTSSSEELNGFLFFFSVSPFLVTYDECSSWYKIVVNISFIIYSFFLPFILVHFLDMMNSFPHCLSIPGALVLFVQCDSLITRLDTS